MDAVDKLDVKIVGVRVLKGVDMRETSDRIKDFRPLVPPSGVLNG
jgi:hypothetical protein